MKIKTKTLLFTTCLLMWVGQLVAQSVVHGYGLEPSGLHGEQLPSGNLLLSTSGYNFSGSELNWVELDPIGNVLQRQGTFFNQFIRFNASTVLADGRHVAAGIIELPSHLSPFTIVRDGASLGDGTEFAVDNLGEFLGLVAMPDSGYLALGYRNTPVFQFFAAAARVDKHGDTLWTRAYEGTDSVFVFNDGVALPGGDILLTGTHDQNLSSRYDMVVARMAPDGALRWVKRYAASEGSILPLEMVKNASDQFYISVHSVDTVNEKTAPGILRVDTAGNLLWGKFLSGYPHSESSGITLSAAQEPILYGYYDPALQGNYVGFLAAFDSTGGLSWSSGYTSQGSGSVKAALLQPSNALTVVMGDDVAAFQTQVLFADSQGGLSPTSCGAEQPAFTVQPLTFSAFNFSFIAHAGLGHTVHSITPFQPNVTDSVLCALPIGIQPRAAQLAVEIVPHPLRSSARIRIDGLSSTESMQLQVTDVQGRVLPINVEAVADGFLLNRDGLSAGLYAYQVLQGGRRIASGKLLVQD